MNDLKLMQIESRMRDLQENTNFVMNLLKSITGYAVIVGDFDGNILVFNEGARRIFGYASQDVVGPKSIEELYPNDFVEAGGLDALFDKLLNKGGCQYELERERKGGETFHCQSLLTIVIDNEGRMVGFVEITEDTTERKQAEDKIKSALAEKETLLKEIHHRVKNNMQVLSSLLRMQSGFLKDDDDKRMFQESQMRIQSMSLVYNKLYQSENLASISLHSYVKDLVGNLIKSCNVSAEPPHVLIDIDDIGLSLDFAIPCGLIINEVVTNSLKYAFPQGRAGQIHIIIHQKDGRIEMSLGDDGVGLPEGLTIGSTKSLGMVLIQTLTVHQLGGTLELKRENGTEYLIGFPLVFEG